MGATRKREGGKKEERGRRKRKSGGGFETLPEMAQYFSECPTLVLYSHSGTGTKGPVLHLNSSLARVFSIEIHCHFSPLLSISPLSQRLQSWATSTGPPGPQNKSPHIYLKRTRPQEAQPKTLS